MARGAKTATRLLSILAWIATFLTYAASFRDQPHYVWGMLCLVAGTFLLTLVHEGGHAIAAWSRGWQILQIVVGPLGLQLPNRDVAFVRQAFREQEFGWVASVPRGPEVDTRRSWAIIVAAGPAASFALGLLALIGWTGFLRRFDSPAVSVSQIGLGLALQSLHFSLFAILPDGGEGRNDGDLLRELRRADRDLKAGSPLTWIGTLLGSRVRLSALPAWLLTAAKARPAPTLEEARYLATVEIGIALDSSPVDVGRARRLLDDYRALYGSDDWHAACDAWHSAIWERSPGRAEAALRALPGSPEPYPLSLAAQAAVAAVTGQSVLARVRLKEMREAVKRESPFRDLTYRDIGRQIEAAIG